MQTMMMCDSKFDRWIISFSRIGFNSLKIYILDTKFARYSLIQKFRADNSGRKRKANISMRMNHFLSLSVNSSLCFELWILAIRNHLFRSYRMKAYSRSIVCSVVLCDRPSSTTGSISFKCFYCIHG